MQMPLSVDKAADMLLSLTVRKFGKDEYDYTSKSNRNRKCN